jgi:hypothetical protein
MSRFDYVRYDEEAQACQAELKTAAQAFEAKIDEHLQIGSRPHQKALDALEEVYMWCGKGIRDQQITRNGDAPLQEERSKE